MGRSRRARVRVAWRGDDRWWSSGQQGELTDTTRPPAESRGQSHCCRYGLVPITVVEELSTYTMADGVVPDQPMTPEPSAVISSTFSSEVDINTTSATLRLPGGRMPS